jgi:regulator of replication initiation timing
MEDTDIKTVVTDLKTRLDATLDKLKESNRRNDELLKKLSEITKKNKELVEANDNLSTDYDLLKAVIEKFEKQVPAAPANTSGGIVLSGQKYDIILQGNVEEVVHRWRDHTISDEDMALVVKKT